MRWQVDLLAFLRTMTWVCVVMAVASCGAVIVRNVTDTLIAMADHPPITIALDQPTR